MMHMRAWRLTFFAAIPALLFGCAIEPQRERVIVFQPDPAQPSDQCITLASVRRSEVLDEQNIVFYMRGERIFRNWLPRRCAGLNRRDAFSYETTIGRLCRGDIITVIDTSTIGQIPGPRCALGDFYPMTELEADALKDEIERVRELGLEN